MSQIEILVALGVLAVGILGVCSVFAFGTRAAGQGARITDATARCRQIVDLMRARNLPFGWTPSLPPGSSGLNDAEASRRDLAAPPFSADLPSDTGFTRNIKVEWVSQTAGDYRNILTRITVGVYWFDHGSERKVVLQALHRQP